MADDKHWGSLILMTDETPSSGENNAPARILFPMDKSHVTVGRRPGSDVHIHNPCISATHCIIARSLQRTVVEYRVPPNLLHQEHSAPLDATTLMLHSVATYEFTLADMSTNGCFINRSLVGKGRVGTLRPGDVVELVRAAPDKSSRYNMVFAFNATEEEVTPIATPSAGVAVCATGATAPTDAESEAAANGPSSKVEADDGPGATANAVALLEQHVADDMSVGSRADLDPVQRPESEALLLCNDNEEVPAENIVARESSSEVLRRRHLSAVDACYTLDKHKPLGEGSFAVVYSAVLSADVADNGHPAVVRLLAHALPDAPALSEDATPTLSMEERLKRYTFAIKVIKKNRILLPSESPPIDTPHTTNPQEDTIRRILDNEDDATTVDDRKKLFLSLNPENRKMVERELKNRQRQQREVDILLSVRHPNIVGLFEIFESAAQLAFVMERCEGGELFPLVQTIGALPEFFVKIVVYQILLGVQYLHNVGIAHRDLKLENVLLSKNTSVAVLCQLQRDAALQARRQPTNDAAGGGAKRDRTGVAIGSGTAWPRDVREWYQSTVLVDRMWWPQVKISDFGLSRAIDASTAGRGASALMSTMCGTPLYAAPEVTITSLRGSAAGYTEAVDLFSVGVLCFAMLCGRPPFPNQRDPLGRPQKGRLDYLAPLTWERKQAADVPRGEGGAVDLAQVPSVQVSPDGRDFAAKLLKLRPAERMSAIGALKHPWLQDCQSWCKGWAPSGEQTD